MKKCINNLKPAERIVKYGSLCHLIFMKRIFFFFFIFITVLTVACQKVKKPIYSYEDLKGTWIRTSSSRTLYDSMTVEITDSSNGAIIKTINSNSNSYFSVGNLKWKNITPNDDSTFVYEDFGSDGKYYSAGMTYLKYASSGKITLFLDINSNGQENGSWQYWEKQ